MFIYLDYLIDAGFYVYLYENYSPIFNGINI